MDLDDNEKQEVGGQKIKKCMIMKRKKWRIIG